MTINTTRWSPDTCGCELEYEWNTEENENVRKHEFARIVKACSAHNAIVPPNTTSKPQLKRVFDAVAEENTRKNQALAKALQVRPELADIVDGTTGKRYDLMTVAKQMKSSNPQKLAEELGVGTTLKEGINYTWRWVEPKVKAGQPRTLEIDFETPAPTIEEVIAVRSANPNATTEQVRQQVKQRIIGEPDKLQEVLDSEFKPEKGRGKVRIASARSSSATSSN